jgi:3-oxoacyl-[acyl-carrier protein] reductase
MDLKGKTAWITGVSRGIGKAIAMSLAEAGAEVAGSARDVNRLREAMGEIEALGVRVLPLVVDVGNGAEVKEAAEKILQEFGHLDILVNNAGITRDNLLIRMREEEWDEVLRVNLTGAFHCTKAVIRPMMKQRNGRIINISSVVGVMGNAGQANYAASKAALIGFTKSIAREYANRGITVNAVAPGFIETEMTHSLSKESQESLLSQIPMQRFGMPGDVASVVRFLASDDAGYVTGQVIHVNGGMWM